MTNQSQLHKRNSTTACDSKVDSSHTAVLILSDGTVFYGKGIGYQGNAVGEVCFNTSMTGYQEILTDPSYAGQIITFTFPHIGNVGTNDDDIECDKVAARGVVLKANITNPSNHRSTKHLNEWLKEKKLIGITGIDTRDLTIRIRDNGAPNGVIAYSKDGQFDLDALKEKASSWAGLDGMDLAKEVTCDEIYEWSEGVQTSSFILEPKQPKSKNLHVVAMDFGAKRNILRCLVNAGVKVTVVPATTSFNDIVKLKPDGIFLSNGPGDPAATGKYAVPTIKSILEKEIPVFGICLGHQMLALALGGKTIKMEKGHRGANHPVKDLSTGKVEITSQNHGFMVLPETLPDNVEVSHISLFDKSNEGIKLKDKPAFSVQYHPEASPGPHDSHYLFEKFVRKMSEVKR